LKRGGGIDSRLPDPNPQSPIVNRQSSIANGQALRLGMRMVKGLRETDAKQIEQAVASHGRFEDIETLHRISGVRAESLRHLGAADAFGSMGLNRQAALWQIRADQR